MATTKAASLATSGIATPSAPYPTPPTSPTLIATTPATALLDSTAYPHVLDTITTYATRPTLLALRATCRHLARRADALLGHHVIVDLTTEPSGYAYMRLKSIDNGRIPRLRGGGALFDDGRSAEAVKSWCQSGEGGGVAPLASTKVVDVRGRLTPGLIPGLETLTRALPHLTHLRLDTAAATDMAPLPLASATLVLFASLLPAHRPRSLLPHVPALPAGVDRVVINVAYHNGGDAMVHGGFIQPYGRVGVVDEVVVLFTKLGLVARTPCGPWPALPPPRPPTSMSGALGRPVPGTTPVVAGPSHPLGVLHHLIRAHGTHVLVRRYTFVGLAEIDPVWLGMPGASGREVEGEVVAGMWGHVAVLRAGWGVADEVDDVGVWPPQIEFLSRGRYRERVGKGVFALETVG